MVVLLIPVVVLNLLASTVPRFIVIYISAMLFVSTITAVSKGSMAGMFVAGPPYSAVLVIFISGNWNSLRKRNEASALTLFSSVLFFPFFPKKRHSFDEMSGIDPLHDTNSFATCLGQSRYNRYIQGF